MYTVKMNVLVNTPNGPFGGSNHVEYHYDHVVKYWFEGCWICCERADGSIHYVKKEHVVDMSVETDEVGYIDEMR